MVGERDMSPSLCENCMNSSKECLVSTCTKETFKRRVPIYDWLPKYQLNWIVHDILAGLTVGLTVIPQGLAYAIVAGLPPEYGLYSSFMGCFIYCVLGTSKDITLGPTAIMSLMVAEFGGDDKTNKIYYAIALCFMTGCIQIFMGLSKLGFLVNFISFSVVSGFTSAAAITIAWGQVNSALGIEWKADELPGGLIHDGTFLGDIYGVFRYITRTNFWDLGVSIITIICLLILKFLKDKSMEWQVEAERQRINSLDCEIEGPTTLQLFSWKFLWFIGTARNPIIIILAALITWGLWLNGQEKISRVGYIPSGLPPFEAPQFSIPEANITVSEFFQEIGVGLVVLPLIGFLESIAIAKSFARKNKYTIDADQELMALGISNFLGSFVSSYPVTGSFSRTAVNSQTGVKTQLGGLFTGLIVILALLVLTPCFEFIPKAGLSGVIISAVVFMIDYRSIPKLWVVNKIDLLSLTFTFLGSLLFGIEIGVALGIAVDILLILYRTAKPKIKVDPLPILVITLNTGLNFPAIEYAKSQIENEANLNSQECPERIQHVVLDCSHIFSLDYTSFQGLSQLIEEFKSNEAKIYFSSLQPLPLDILERGNIPGFKHFKTTEEAKKHILDTVQEELCVIGDIEEEKEIIPNNHVVDSTNQVETHF